MPENIRSFIAIELSPNIREFIAQIQNEFKKNDADVKWVEPQNAHLTLKFLGDVPLAKIEKIEEVIREACSKTSSIPTEITGLGTFPKIDSFDKLRVNPEPFGKLKIVSKVESQSRRVDFPRVIWLGLKDEEKKLQMLTDAIEHALVSLKFPKKPYDFKSHITIGRVRSNKNLHSLMENLKNYFLPRGLTQIIQEVTLFKSTLTCQGPIYEVLRKFHLR